MELLLIFVSPVLMIILSGKRIKGKITLPIIAIVFLSIVVDLLCAFAMAYIMLYQLSQIKDGHFHCGTGAVAGSIGFAMIDGLFIILSGIIFSIYYYSKHSKESIL